MRKALSALALVLTAAVVTPVGVSDAGAPAPPGPALSVPAARLARALHCPKSFPSGRKPVLLVHGTSVTDEENWGWTYAKQLPRIGFDVCTVLLPDFAFEDIQVSSEYVVFALRRMAERSKQKVSVVGLSQGAIQPRWAIRWWPDVRMIIDDYVSMAGTNHGAAFGNASCSSPCLPALWQQTARSENYRASSRLLTALNAGDETPGSLSYTSVYSLTDWVIQPSAPRPTARLAGASNVAVQDICPGRVVEHVQAAWDAAYYAVVVDALTHPGPADPDRVDRAACGQIAMPGVDPADAIARTAVLYAIIPRRQAEHPKVDAEPPLKPYVVVGATSGTTSWHVQKATAGSRRYMLYAPPKVSGPRPLVVYLHGCSERADSTAIASKFNALASKLRFYVVYPEQPDEANGNHCWNWFRDEHQHRGAGEPSIIVAITRSVMERYPIDERRVYVTGISAGGAMAIVMGVTYPELFAAVGSEAGIQYRGAPYIAVPSMIPPEQSGEWAYEEMGTRARQVPFFALVGDLDTISPRENTERAVRQWLYTNDRVDDGKANGSVPSAPKRTDHGDAGYPYEVDRYVGASGCLIAERWLIKGLDHAHSGGDDDENWSDPAGPNAASASYRFFMDHPMRSGRRLPC